MLFFGVPKEPTIREFSSTDIECVQSYQRQSSIGQGSQSIFPSWEWHNSTAVRKEKSVTLVAGHLSIFVNMCPHSYAHVAILRKPRWSIR